MAASSYRRGGHPCLRLSAPESVWDIWLVAVGGGNDCYRPSACCRRARQVCDIDLRRMGRLGGAATAASARGRSGNDDRSTAAAHDLAVDENILAFVDRDVVTVFVGVVTPTILAGVVDGERVGGRRGQGDNGQGADEGRCVLEA